MGFNVTYSSSVLPEGPGGNIIWGYFEGASGGTLQPPAYAGNGNQQPIRISNTQQHNRIYVAGENACGIGVPAIRLFEFSSNCNGGGDVEYITNLRQSKSEAIKEKVFQSFSVSPNPANSIIVVSVPDEYLFSTLKLISLQGNTIKSIALNARTTNVIVSGLASGLYTAQIEKKGTVIRKQKLIIAR